MISRWLWFSVCAILGLVMLVCGLLMPIHLRAVETSVLQRAGRNSLTLTGRGLALAGEGKLGAAQLLLQAARAERLPDREVLDLAVAELAQKHPGWVSWGGGDARLERLFDTDPQSFKSAPEPLTEFVLRAANREVVLGLLRSSTSPVVQELLRCRKLTHTAIFPPSDSASGQALDAALGVCGLLLEEGRLAPGLRDTVLALASEANRGGSSQPLEQVLLDLMSLGQRFNWDQLEEFASRLGDTETLRLQASFVRKAGAQLPLLFSAVELSGNAAQVAAYLSAFSQTGLKDIGTSLRFGAGGVNELLRRNQLLHESQLDQRWAGHTPLAAFFNLALDYCWLMPGFALAIKWLFYAAGGFCLAMAGHFAWPAATELERPLQVRGFHLAREFLFALGFLLVVLFLSEPFIAQEGQKAAIPFRLRLPMAGGAAPAGSLNVKSSLMNEPILLTLLLFFVLQGLLYTACLVKLAEIRRQRVPSRVKLKLLENEDHLFDAGLYLGFVGTIISFILFSLGIMKLSLMAAYSSTSFGIIFVSIFKIFHLRPARRLLLLEAEAAAPQPVARAAAPALASAS